MKPSFFPKNERNIAKISALNARAEILAIFRSFFGKNDDFINLFRDLLAFKNKQNIRQNSAQASCLFKFIQSTYIYSAIAIIFGFHSMKHQNFPKTDTVWTKTATNRLSIPKGPSDLALYEKFLCLFISEVVQKLRHKMLLPPFFMYTSRTHFFSTSVICSCRFTMKLGQNFCLIFRSFLGQLSVKKNSFWDLLTIIQAT